MNPSDVLTFIRQHPDQIIDALKHEHRTHQQSTCGSIVTILKAYGEFNTDPRNQESVTWAAEVTKDHYGFSFL